MNTLLLFTYGTLQDEAIQMALLGRKLIGNNDVLLKFKLETLKIPDSGETEFSTYFIAVYTGIPTDTITGTVYTIHKNELNKLDSYEGPNYKRSLVKLKSDLEAYVYHE